MTVTIKHFGLLQNLSQLRSLLYQQRSPHCCQTPQRQFGLRNWKWCSAIRHGPEHFTLILVPCVINDVPTSPTYHRTPVDRPSSESTSIPKNSQPVMLMSCSIFGFGSGFVIQSAGFTFVPTFFVTNRPALEASCIQCPRYSHVLRDAPLTRS